MTTWQEIKEIAAQRNKGDLNDELGDFLYTMNENFDRIAALVDATIAEHEQIKNCETIPCYAAAPCDACLEAVGRTAKAIKELEG